MRIATVSRNLMLIGLLLALPKLNDARANVSTEHKAEVTEAEYEVLSAYISHALTGEEGRLRVGHEVSSIVIINTTQSDRDDSQNEFKASSLASLKRLLRRKVPRLEVAMIEAFRAANTKDMTLRPSFHLAVVYCESGSAEGI